MPGTPVPYAYYNEHDPFAATWLDTLIAAGHLPPGWVDRRSIVEVQATDLNGFTQCHFFAGIGGWALALRLAGWPDDRPVWTGSCPCQPFSAAGKGHGERDPRHLWPEFRRLIAECRPAVVFGEQVASAAGRAWLNAVFADGEELAYAGAGADLCAPGVQAPHIRQRLYFVLVADAERRAAERHGHELAGAQGGTQRAAQFVGLADCGCSGLPERERDGRVQREAMGAQSGQATQCGSDACGMADAVFTGRPERRPVAGGGSTAGGRESCGLADTEGGRAPAVQQPRQLRVSESAGEVNDDASADHGGWARADWLLCRDGKFRPVEPGTFPLAHGLPARVGRLRGYGNAIVPALAAEFIAAYQDSARGE